MNGFAGGARRDSCLHFFCANATAFLNHNFHHHPLHTYRRPEGFSLNCMRPNGHLTTSGMLQRERGGAFRIASEKDQVQRAPAHGKVSGEMNHGLVGPMPSQGPL
jgi:hypothetical protein